MLAVTFLLSVVFAMPLGSCPQHTTSFPVRAASPCKSTATIPPPGNTALPPPTARLQYVLLGVGTQNYSCTGLTGKAPTQIGALADLYDITPLANCEESAAELLPRYIVNATDLGQASQYPKFGKHFFTTTTTPTFDLTSVGQKFYGMKSGSTPAPANAPKGPGGEAAVAWLYLTQNAGYPSSDVTSVYRVETAGGSPPATCPSEAEINKRYVALYFIY